MATKSVIYYVGKDGYVSSSTTTKTKKNGTVITKTKQIKNKQKTKDEAAKAAAAKAQAKKDATIVKADKRSEKVVSDNNTRRINRAKIRDIKGKATMTDKAIISKSGTSKSQANHGIKLPSVGGPIYKDKRDELGKLNLSSDKKAASKKKTNPADLYGYDYNGVKRGPGSLIGKGTAIDGYGYFKRGGKKS